MAIINMVIKGGGSGNINNQDKTITENGSYTYDNGYTGLGTVTVNVPTLDEVIATPNSLNFVENKNVLINDGSLFLNTLNNIGEVYAISENGFCVCIEDMTLVLREFKDGVIGNIIERNENYTVDMLNGLITTQIPMHGNTILASYEYVNNMPIKLMAFKSPILLDSPSFKHIVFEDLGEVCLPQIGSFGDRYLYTVGSKTAHIYDVVSSKMFNLDLSSIFGTTNVSVVCFTSNNKNYIVNISETNYMIYELSITDTSVEFNVQEGTLLNQHFGNKTFDISNCHQTKDGRYVLCKDGYIEIINDGEDNIQISVFPYNDKLLDIFGGIKVNHIQPLYDGYIGFGMEDGRYILCWMDTLIPSLNELNVIYNFEPSFVAKSRNNHMYNMFFSGYAEYWIGKINALQMGLFKTQVKECETSYVVKENVSATTIASKTSINGYLSSEDSGLYKVKTLPLDIVSKTIIAPTSSAKLSVEGLRSDILKGVRYND